MRNGDVDVVKGGGTCGWRSKSAKSSSERDRKYISVCWSIHGGACGDVMRLASMGAIASKSGIMALNV